MGWISMAALYYEMKDYKNTIEACEYVLAIDKDHFQAHHLKSKAYLKLGEFNKATEGVDKCLEKEHQLLDKDEFYLHLCRVYIANNDDEKLEIYGRKLIEFYPEMHWGWMYTANALINMGRWKDAIPITEKVFEFDPDSTSFLFFYALACTKAEENEKAIRALEHLLEISPNDENIEMAYKILSNSYYRLGDEKKSEEYYQKGLEINPEMGKEEEEEEEEPET